MQLPILSSKQPSAQNLHTLDSNTSTIHDNFGRPITYLRLAVTDKCNLRCTYCMPEQMRFLPKKDILTDEEIIRTVRICAGFGIRKIRLTGGEPFARPNFLELVREIKQIQGVEDIHITTNGVGIADKVQELVDLGVSSVNLSMDTFNKVRFKELTRRDEFESVQRTFYALLNSNISLSVNAVVMDGKNTDDIIPMAELTRFHSFDMRFIEEMPFNGSASYSEAKLQWNYAAIENHLRNEYPQIERLGYKDFATADLFRIPNYVGRVGIIAGFSRTFCGKCNRIRITAKGVLKTCLYDNGVLDIKQLIRSGASDSLIREQLLNCIAHRHKDGIEAEKATHIQGNSFDSMSSIGG